MRAGFKSTGFEPTIFRIPNLPERDAVALLIQPPSLVFMFLIVSINKLMNRNYLTD